MQTPIRCFWLESTTRAERYLRRYRGSDGDARNNCPRHGYHHVMNLIDEIDVHKVQATDGCGWHFNFGGLDDPALFEKTDPRWPTQCDCGEPFDDNDRWQVFTERIYVRTDTGERTTLDNVGPGAMWDAEYLGPLRAGETERPPDGITLMVRCPGGDWFVDGRAANGPGWTRTGDPRAKPPTVTAMPSILIHPNCSRSYHGWLRDGMLVPV